MAGSIVDRDIPNPIGTNLILNSREEVKGAYNYSDVASDASGLMVLTNQRVILSPGYGRVRYGQVTSIQLDQISGASPENVVIAGKTRPALAIYANRKLILALSPALDFSDSVQDIVQAIQELASSWRSRSQEQTVVNVNIDFADLRSYIDRGGYVIKELKCPSCGSPFQIPVQGSVTKCQYCGVTLVAEDVFARLKQLIG